MSDKVKKEIMLKTYGTHYVNGESDEIQMASEGVMYQSDNKICIEYSESTDFIGQDVTSLLEIEDEKIVLTRTSGNEVVSIMEFVEGKRFERPYRVEPMGDLTLEVLTNTINNNIEFEKGGYLELDYMVGIRQIGDSRNKLRFEIDSL